MGPAFQYCSQLHIWEHIFGDFFFLVSCLAQLKRETVYLNQLNNNHRGGENSTA